MRSGSGLGCTQAAAGRFARTGEGLDLDLQAYLEGGKLIAPKELGKLDVELLDVKREIRTITGRVGTGVHQLVLKGDGGQVALFR